MARFTCARGLALGLLLASSSAANAASVTWLLEGTMTQAASGSEITALGITSTAGDPFSVRLTFDTSTPVTNSFPNGPCPNGGPGTDCRYQGASAADQYFSLITINAFTVTQFRFPQLLGDVYFNQIIVRNNRAGFLPNNEVVDGYSWGTDSPCLPNQCAEGQEADSAGAIFRGNEDLNVVQDGLVLPTDPPAGLTSLGIRSFQYCGGIFGRGIDGRLANDCRFASVQATINRITRIAAVPEPGSLALLGLGLAGLGLSRRRRVAA